VVVAATTAAAARNAVEECCSFVPGLTLRLAAICPRINNRESIVSAMTRTTKPMWLYARSGNIRAV